MKNALRVELDRNTARLINLIEPVFARLDARLDDVERVVDKGLFIQLLIEVRSHGGPRTSRQH